MNAIPNFLKAMVMTLLLTSWASAVHATEGYFSHGYGMKAKGMGGAATAMAVDAFGGANNPASMVWVGDRLDIGVDWIKPERSAERVGSLAGVDFSEDSSRTNFFIPEIGYNKMLWPDLALGVSVYGNGLNTDYHSGNSVASCAGLGQPRPGNPACGIGKLGVDVTQVIIAPTLSYKLTETQSVGVAPLFAYQRFAAYGLQPFAAISIDPAHLTNNGHDTSTGWGVRVGWQGRFGDRVTLGAAYSSRIYTSTFDKYRGLLADQGDIDVPENYNLGIALQATPELTLAFDYQRINYSGVHLIGNSSILIGQLGASGDNAIGFGWQDIDVYKFGAQYRYNERLTLRAGYNHSDNPVRPENVTLDILAPGVVQDHLTLGFSYGLGDDSEITMAYMHAFENSVSGRPNPLYFPVGGTETIRMHQNSLGISWSKRF